MSDQDISPEAKADLALEIGHLLFIDVVGYSKLLVNDQIELIQRLNGIVRATETFRRAEASKKLIRLPTGDGMVLIFYRSPEEPVRCAQEISEGITGDPNIQLRMGIHSGLVNQVLDVNDQMNIAGAAINVGQRVMDCGDAGHILISKHVADDLTQYAHWRPHLHDLGECEVKHGLRLHIFSLTKGNLGNASVPEKLRRSKRWKRADTRSVRPVVTPRWPRWLLSVAIILALVALVTSFLLLYQRRAASRTSTIVPEKSIAVLPFENRSEDKMNAYLTDGIQDEILTRLAKIADLRVISRISTQSYKSAPLNVPEIARQLGVAHILEGSVQKSGDAIRVNVQLIKAATNTQILADTFDRNLTDIFAVESDVAKAVAEQLQVRLTGREERVISGKPTDDGAAYDAYLRGLAYTLKTVPTPANAVGARKYFTDAVRLDPKFALSWALLSIVDSSNYLTQSLEPTDELREEARHAAETAVSLEPKLGEAVLAQGFYHYACLKDYEAAVGYFEHARKLLPNSSQIPESLGYLERRRGQWERSEAYFKQAELLDPRNVSLLVGHTVNYICRRRFPEALQRLERVLDITPDDLDTIVLEAKIAQAQGDLTHASALLGPLHPAAYDFGALELQTYQAILERRPAPMIARLKEILMHPDATLGYGVGELNFWLGWAQEVAGDQNGARKSWQTARSELQRLLNEQPNNYSLLGDLALINMGLGDKTAALNFAERAMAANPVEKDAVRGPVPIEISARVAARVGEHDRAIATLEKLLSTPYDGAVATAAPLTPALLKLDPMFDSLRNDPRFEKLIASPTAK